MDSTWEPRDLPVLEAVVTAADEGDYPVEPQELSKRTGFDDETVQQALWALAYDEPRFFDILDASTMGGRHIAGVRKVTGHARRTVGAWPTPDALADRIVTALNEAAEQESDPEAKGRLKRAAQAVGGVGREVMIRVLSDVMTKGM